MKRFGELLTEAGLSFTAKTKLDYQGCKIITVTCCHIRIWFIEKNNKVDFMAEIGMTNGGATCCHSENYALEDLPAKILRQFFKQKAAREADLEEYGLVPKEQADKAAKWWVDRLRDKPENITRISGNAPIMSAVLTDLLEDNLQKRDIGDRLDRFEKLLSEKLQTNIPRQFGVSLRVDYHPEGILKEAWEESGSSGDTFGRFPWRTRMNVYKDKVTLGEPIVFDPQTGLCVESGTPI